MGKSGNSVLASQELGCAEQLARFFPEAVSVRIPVQVSCQLGGRAQLLQATVL